MGAEKLWELAETMAAKQMSAAASTPHGHSEQQLLLWVHILQVHRASSRACALVGAHVVMRLCERVY